MGRCIDGYFENFGNGQICTRTNEGCPDELTAISSSRCPSDPDLATCDSAGLKYGDLCEGDGECGTNVALDNCDGYDIYVIGAGDGCTVPEIPLGADRWVGVGGDD